MIIAANTKITTVILIFRIYSNNIGNNHMLSTGEWPLAQPLG